MKTPQTPIPTLADKLAKVRADHATAVAAEKAKHAQRLRDTDARVADTKAVIAEEKKLARELDILRKRNDDEVALASKRAHRKIYGELDLPLSPAQIEEDRIERLEATANPDDPEIIMWRRWLEGGVAPGKDRRARMPASGDTERFRREVLAPHRRSPIRSRPSMLTVGHETAHCLVPDRPDANVIKKMFNGVQLGQICVTAEIDAWRNGGDPRADLGHSICIGSQWRASAPTGHTPQPANCQSWNGGSVTTATARRG